MDPVQLLQDFGPWGALLVLTLGWLQRVLKTGIRISVTHDADQMEKLRETIASAAGQADRLAAVEVVQDSQAERVAGLETRVTTLEVRVDERTKRRTTSHPRMPIIKPES